MNWSTLQYQAKPLIDIDDVCSMGMEIEMNINSILHRRKETNSLLTEVKPKLYVVIGMLMSILRRRDFLENQKADIMLLEKMKDNFSRMLNILEEKETKIMSMNDGYDNRIRMLPSTLTYISEMQSILERDIYYSLKIALDRKPETKNDFLYEFFDVLGSNVGVFGGKSRVKSDVKSGFDSISSVGTNVLKSSEGKKKLNEEFDKTFPNFKGFEDLKMVQEVLDND